MFLFIDVAKEVKVASEVKNISNDAPRDADTENHEGGTRRDLTLPQPPKAHQRSAHSQTRIQPECCGEMARNQRYEHTLSTAEGAVQSGEDMEGAGEHGEGE